MLTKPTTTPEPITHRVGEIACDEDLFERLRELRKRLADKLALPPDIIFSDVALRQMARDYPENERDFARISGVGEKKLRDYGEAFLTEIALHLATSARQIFSINSFVTPAKPKKQSDEAPFDIILFERLRCIRKQLAKERGVSAFVILYDSALRQIAREYPTSKIEFERIRNVGPKKSNDFGSLFLAEVALHLQTNARQIFADESLAAAAVQQPSSGSLGNSARETLWRFRSGQTVEQIATDRGVTIGTILGHIAEGIERGETVDLGRFLTDEEQKKIAAAFDRNGFGNLVAVFESLGGAIDYGKLRVFRAAKNQVSRVSQLQKLPHTEKSSSAVPPTLTLSTKVPPKRSAPNTSQRRKRKIREAPQDTRPVQWRIFD